MKDQNNIIGEIKATTSINEEFLVKGHKYLVEVRAFKPIITESLRHELFNVLSPTYQASIYKWVPIKRFAGRFGKALQKVDQEYRDTFYHYAFYVLSKESFAVEDIENELKEHLQENEGCKIQMLQAKKLGKYFPWEQPKIKRMAITKEMLTRKTEVGES